MKTSLFSNIYEYYLNKRYRLYKVEYVQGVQIQVYWTLKKTQIKECKLRINIRRYRQNSNDLSLNLYEEIRKALALRIKRKT